MLSATAKVANKLGFHLRAVSMIVETTSRYRATVTLARSGIRRNAASVLDLMLLEAGEGTELTIEAEGSDEVEALSAVLDLFARKFDEE
jgi:phosphocarrier protein